MSKRLTIPAAAVVAVLAAACTKLEPEDELARYDQTADADVSAPGDVATGSDATATDAILTETDVPSMPILGLCAPCDTDDQCGADADQCLPSGFCGRDCADDPDACPAGYTCTLVEVGVEQCQPAEGARCDEICGFVWCADDAVCVDDVCLPALGLCETGCVDDAQCGAEGDLCIEVVEAHETYCATDCTADPEGCPEGYVCLEVAPGISQCVPPALTCVDRCAEAFCPSGQACDPFTGECGLPRGNCSPCTLSSQCGDSAADLCVELGADTGELVCAMDCTGSPTSCPDGFRCIELDPNLGSKCIPETFTCTDARCADVACGPGEQCDPVDGSCVARLDLCDAPCSNDNACGDPGDACLNFGGEAFCATACEAGGRCPLGYGCFLLTNGGRYCIPETQSCAFGGGGCAFETRYEDCPGNDVYCSAVRPGETGTCLDRCDAAGADTCAAGARCVSVHVHPDLCLPSAPVDPASCGRWASDANPIGRPCDLNLSPLCPSPTDFCYTPSAVAAPFCTLACTSDAACGPGAVCRAVADQPQPICIPAACAGCIADPTARPSLALLESALAAAGVSRCALAVSDAALAILDDDGPGRGELDFTAVARRQPLAALDAALAAADALGPAGGAARPARDAFLGAALQLGVDRPTPASGAIYTPDPSQPLAAAVAAFTTAAGGTPDLAALEADAADVPLALQQQVARVVLAMADALALRDQAFGGGLGGADATFAAAWSPWLRAPSGWPIPSDAELGPWLDHSAWDPAPLVDAMALVLGEIEAAGLATDPTWGTFEFVAETPAGRIVIDGDTDSVWSASTPALAGELALLVDAGGDDVYRIPAGANASLNNPLAIVVDLGGNDTYDYATVADPGDGAWLPSDGDGRWAGSGDLTQEDGAVSLSTTPRQGAGRFGLGLLYDVSGNDSYQSLRVSQGVGIVGVGALVDAAGVDTYAAEALSQGVGLAGVGLLFDGGGADLYRGVAYVQGVGLTGGAGALVDAAGADDYLATPGESDGTDVRYYNLADRARSNLNVAQGAGAGLGTVLGSASTSTEIWAGGVGLLLDRGGDDHYTAAVVGQGGAVDGGVGYAIDLEGTDTWDGRRATQGAALHGGAGVLVERAGDDVYNTLLGRAGVGHGSGDDLGIGVALDEAGDDVRTLGPNAGGVGLSNGIGLLLDDAGSDTYTPAAAPSLGWAATDFSGAGDPMRTGFPTRGFFVDAGAGTDTYGPLGPPDATDDATWTGSANDGALTDETGVGTDG